MDEDIDALIEEEQVCFGWKRFLVSCRETWVLGCFPTHLPRLFTTHPQQLKELFDEDELAIAQEFEGTHWFVRSVLFFCVAARLLA